jgi:hypothetical protein
MSDKHTFLFPLGSLMINHSNTAIFIVIGHEFIGRCKVLAYKVLVFELRNRVNEGSIFHTENIWANYFESRAFEIIK